MTRSAKSPQLRNRRFLLTVPPIAAAVSLAFLLTGCPTRHPPVTGATAGAITIKGSNTFGEELGPRLTEAYRSLRPLVDIQIETAGSASGFAALLDGTADIASASRRPTDDERARFAAAGIELSEYPIGHYGVAVVVHDFNPLTSLTAAQVHEIFTGRITHWSGVGGPDLPVRLFIRDPVSGTHLGFRDLAMAGEPYVPGAQMRTSYAAIVEAVVADPGAVGYVGMQLTATPGLHAISIGRFAPTVLTVNEGWYPYQRRLWLYTDGNRETALARDFVRFVQTNPGQDIIEGIGFVRRFDSPLNVFPRD